MEHDLTSFLLKFDQLNTIHRDVVTNEQLNVGLMKTIAGKRVFLMKIRTDDLGRLVAVDQQMSFTPKEYKALYHYLPILGETPSECKDSSDSCNPPEDLLDPYENVEDEDEQPEDEEELSGKIGGRYYNWPDVTMNNYRKTVRDLSAADAMHSNYNLSTVEYSIPARTTGIAATPNTAYGTVGSSRVKEEEEERVESNTHVAKANGQYRLFNNLRLLTKAVSKSFHCLLVHKISQTL